MAEKDVRVKSAGLNSSQTADTDCLADIEFSGLVARRNTIKYEITLEPARAPSRQRKAGNNVAPRAVKSEDDSKVQRLTDVKPKTPRMAEVPEKFPQSSCINSRSANTIQPTELTNPPRGINSQVKHTEDQPKGENCAHGEHLGPKSPHSEENENISKNEISKAENFYQGELPKPKDHTDQGETIPKATKISSFVKNEIPTRPRSRMIKVKPAQTTAIPEDIPGSPAQPEEPSGRADNQDETISNADRNDRRSVKRILRRVLSLFVPCYRPAADDSHPV